MPDRPSVLRVLVHPVVLAAASALIFGLGLKTLSMAKAATEAARERQARIVVVEATQLAARIAPEASAGGEAAVQSLISAWSQSGPQRQGRVIRLAGAQLLASTFPDELKEPLPRRLHADQKPLYDLGQELRAAVETNISEGVARKRELLFERLDAQHARVSVPVREGDRVTGLLQIEMVSPFVPFAPPLLRVALAGEALSAALLAFSAFWFSRRLRPALVKYRYAYAYVAPAMAGMLVLVFFPFIYGIALSFTGQTILNVNEPITDLWVGLQNYQGVLGDFSLVRHSEAGWLFDYQNFYWTLGVTVIWTISNVTIGVTFGMLLALALNTPGLIGKPIYRVLLILPWAIPNYITSLIWRGLFHPQFGAVNQAIQMFGGEPVAWFDSVPAAFLTGLAANGWLSFSFMMVVILGGLQSISADMYEAATVEGATRWQQYWRITLPLLKPTLIPAIVLSVVWTFNMFNVIYLVSGGAPAGANEILITRAYKIAFEEYRYGYAAAYSVVIFLILLAYGVFQTRITRATEAAHT